MKALRWVSFLFAWLIALRATPLFAAGELDYKLLPRQIADSTYVVIGKTEDFSRSNGGNIVNTAFIVTADGVVVIDSGPSRLYGEQLRQAIGKVTSKPVIRVFNTHHHPDHFLGNQSIGDTRISALAATITAQRQEGAAFVDNLFRLSGDWMKGTEPVPANESVGAGRLTVGGHELEVIAMTGHTAGDLVLLDHKTGVLFAGDLVFFNRAPTTPHASIGEWLTALERLAEIKYRILVPGHGEPVTDGRAVAQTRRYLQWVEETLRLGAERGVEMSELLAQTLPSEFADIPLAKSEFARSVAHLYRRYEAATLQRLR
jgi:quinoprotein relay system zinc metallohydrolase 1